jgi:spermidine/putrescine transport system substrate-binding protein
VPSGGIEVWQMDDLFGSIDEAIVRDAMRSRLTRRGFLRAAGVGVGALGLSSLLGACGEASTGTTAAQDVFTGAPGSTINFANWPLYIDKTKDPQTGERYSPSLRAFTKETGIDVSYKEAIQDNPVFFGKIQPQLQAGQSTGWDLIVMSNGWEFWVLKEKGWVYPLDTSRRPNFDRYALEEMKDPVFDPGAAHSMAWQWGLTSIAVNHDLVSAPISTLNDLMDTKKLKPDSVGMLKDDMADFVMKNLGIDPVTSGPTEWKEAASWLMKQRETGLVRQYYSQGYADDMTAGNLAATMAWSGDVIYYQVWGGYPNLEFVVPDRGAVMWVDNMMIPAHAANPVGALELMDYYYLPKPATQLQEYVMYMSPSTATKARFLADADEAEAQGSPGYANKLRTSANDPYLFPTKELMSNVSFMRQLRTDDEKAEWDAIFEPISQA